MHHNAGLGRMRAIPPDVLLHRQYTQHNLPPQADAKDLKTLSKKSHSQTSAEYLAAQ